MTPERGMALGDALMLTGLVAAAVGALAIEMWRRVRQEPRPWLYGWAAWGVVVLVGSSYFLWRSGYPPLEAVLYGLFLGAVGYPVIQGLFWLRFGQQIEQAREDALDRTTRRYHAVDFGAPPRTLQEPPSMLATSSPTGRMPAAYPRALQPETPLVGQPQASALARAVTPASGALERVVDWIVVGAVTSAGAFLFLVMYVGVPTEIREVVGGELAARGYPAARLERDWMPMRCHRKREIAYRWRAAGGEGRVCVDRVTAEGKVWVDRTWTRDSSASPL